ncbi:MULTISPECIES: FliM/FliN family flagellar motor switch protein [unclassified Herbaspirillum]|uniref:FliM/FliN family flagellar motor switch protein n=1 Tax=unclassified Herbaspirillum TaxID=2624150 RepID=UPI001153B136|nr:MULTISPECIES: FliM/FliN family flagellar motor switch protein [unclassified Herbaspirillum]MBB5390574.1 type III secretion protein Q [Herbaspirillum sp. SJZ102]TQK08938.1 type III secretion protein Q [Herbaspirillum sp. SJZ130]TQK14375.1 type III secretion protein Q [Herbaspirillum sp. SJZ106]
MSHPRLPNLRAVTMREAMARAALANWPRRNPALAGKLAYGPVPKTPALVALQAFADGLCWEGFLDLDEWLASVAPEVAALAVRQGDATQYARSLFELAEQPVELPLPELRYATLCFSGTEPAPSSRLLSVKTPQGRVWLDRFPEVSAIPAAPLSAAAGQLPVALAWRLGYSRVSVALLARLERGDVLLIATETFELSSADKAIARYGINENGEIFVNSDNPIDNPAAASQDAGSAFAIGHDPAPHAEASTTSLSEIPLRLDFILQRRVYTVAQLDAFYRGQVLQLDPQAEKQVEIVANGMRLAMGELVEINGRLGVELHELGGKQALSGAPRV